MTHVVPPLLKSLPIVLMGYSRKKKTGDWGLWNFQMYQRNSMWNFQGLIKKKWNFQRWPRKNGRKNGDIALSYPPRVRVTVKLSAAFFNDESSITIEGVRKCNSAEKIMWSFHGSSLLNVGLGISKGSNTTLWNPGMEICFLWNFQGQSKAMKTSRVFFKIYMLNPPPPPFLWPLFVFFLE